MTNPKKNTSPSPGTRAAVFRDTLYSSRVLILPDARQLPVSHGLVSAAPDDSVALAYLQEHPDLEPLE